MYTADGKSKRLFTDFPDGFGGIADQGFLKDVELFSSHAWPAIR